jgi:hypothetical protein
VIDADGEDTLAATLPKWNTWTDRRIFEDMIFLKLGSKPAIAARFAPSIESCALGQWQHRSGWLTLIEYLKQMQACHCGVDQQDGWLPLILK